MNEEVPSGPFTNGVMPCTSKLTAVVSTDSRVGAGTPRVGISVWRSRSWKVVAK